MKNKFPKSIIGWILVIAYIYVVVDILVTILGNSNDGMGEGIFILVAGFPWVIGTILIPALLNLPEPYFTIIELVPAVTINSFILYWIGVGIQSLLVKLKNNFRLK